MCVNVPNGGLPGSVVKEVTQNVAVFYVYSDSSSGFSSMFISERLVPSTFFLVSFNIYITTCSAEVQLIYIYK